MKDRFLKVLRMMLGFAIIGCSTMISKQSGSLSSWNVLNDGLANVLPITIGQANTLVGIIIIVIDIIARESLGIGTVLNAIFIGMFSDIFININNALGIIPKVNQPLLQLPLCFLAIIVGGFGVYLYMSAQMGSGPRDSLMLALTKRVPFQVGYCRMALEAAAFLVGVLLGGEFGLGTFIAVLSGGPCIQKISKIAGFDMKKIHNESFVETYDFIKSWITNRKNTSRSA
ncbi:MAG: hypothetical protein VB078_05220 [Clostridiaceae bacterium]|nr:hypothetical protein [Clostridiaceae bacterium]